MIHHLEVFFRAWRRRISRSEWAIRRLRLPTSQETSHDPGLVLIQIDGLSRTQFERAMARGRLPFLRHLHERQHYDVGTFYPGLPTTTPAVQAELYYGMRCAVPAFTFFNRASAKVRSMFDPKLVGSIEAHLKTHGQGLLTGGSSWSNIYTGGATKAECHFCAASLGLGDMLTSKSFSSFLNIVLPQFPAVCRLLGLLFAECFIALWDMVRGYKRAVSLTNELKFIIKRVAVCIGLREFICIGAKIDVARGLPVIHVNFLGYDEQAHHRGPDSAFAHWTLKGIDHAIERLYRGALRSGRRDYQVWIFSDHGQERVQAYSTMFPGHIDEAVRKCLPPPEAQDSSRPPSEPRPFHWPPFEHSSAPPTSGTEAPSKAGEELYTFAGWGPVGHLYLTRPLSIPQKREFARRLVKEAKIPGVLFLTAPGEVEWTHGAGISKLPGDGEERLSQSGVLQKEVARDLVTLCAQQFAGDVILLGWSREHPPVSFASEYGAHAGPGPIETEGFTLLPARTRVPDPAKPYLRPSDLRAAALDFLDREKLPTETSLPPRPTTHALRVMTYNVHSCLGMDGKVSPQRIAQLIDRYHPDVVALQEIDLGKVRSREQDQAKLIADALRMHVCFCPTVVRGNEQYGHALLSRFPIEVKRTGVLSSGASAEGREPRGALWVQVEAHGVPLHIINTHFGLGRTERMAQAADLLAENWMGQIGPTEPLILCGDFNMLPQSRPYRALASRVRDAQLCLARFKPLNTFTSFRTIGRIDHIFISPHFDVEKIQVPRTHLTRVASDHLPLIVDLAWSKKDQFTLAEISAGKEL